MFCKKCGTQVADNQRFCPKCGTELGGGMPPAGTKTATATSAKKLPIIPIVIVAVVVILGIVLVKSLFFPSYTKVVKNYISALEKQDPEALLELYPDAYIEYMDDEMDMDADDLKDNLEDMLDDMEDYFDGKIKLKYTIDDDVDDMRNRELKEYEETWAEDIEVKEGKKIEVKIEVYVDGDKEDRYNVDYALVKIGSKWYMAPGYANMYFWY